MRVLRAANRYIVERYLINNSYLVVTLAWILNLSKRTKGRSTYVSIVTALFGTVLNRFTLNPLYNPDQPSLITIFLAVWIAPRRECRFTIPSEDMSSANGRFWVCNRVRTTSCGYVAIEAVIFAIAEQVRIVRGGSGTSEEPSRITNYVGMVQHRVPGENTGGKWLTRPYLQLLVERELDNYMRNAQETWEQTTVKCSDTF